MQIFDIVWFSEYRAMNLLRKKITQSMEFGENVRPMFDSSMFTVYSLKLSNAHIHKEPNRINKKKKNGR